MNRTLSRRILFLAVLHAVLVSCDFAVYWTRRSSLIQITYVGREPYHEPEDVMVSVDDGGGVQSITGQPLSPDSNGVLLHTRTHGTATIRVLLALSDTIADAAFELPLTRDQVHFIYIYAGTSDSTFSPSRSRPAPRFAVAMRPGHPDAARDSIWIHWGSNSISHPVIY